MLCFTWILLFSPDIHSTKYYYQHQFTNEEIEVQLSNGLDIILVLAQCHFLEVVDLDLRPSVSRSVMSNSFQPHGL